MTNIRRITAVNMKVELFKTDVIIFITNCHVFDVALTDNFRHHLHFVDTENIPQ